MFKKKVAGIMLVVVAILLLTLGIVLGLLIPNLALKQVKGRTCVDSKESAGYNTWEGPTHGTTRIYIWNITNKDGFLYRGEKPKLEEKGPYVYSTTSKQIDVTFENEKRTSKPFEKGEFNESLTKEECPTCGENDQFAVLNIAYLTLMTQAESALSFSAGLIPFATNVALRSGNRSNLLVLFGLLQLPPNVSSIFPTFGTFLNSTPSFTLLLEQRNRTSFTLVEMSGLYGAMEDVQKFGNLTNTTAVASCSRGIPTMGCGLFINLQAYLTMLRSGPGTLSPGFANVTTNIDEILCPSVASSCFKAPSKNETIRLLYRRAAADFMLGPFRRSVLKFLEDNNYGLITRRGQRDLALGYVMKNLSFPPLYPNGIPVPGVITSHANEKEAKKSARSSSFYTCKATAEKTFTWAAYNGETKVNQAFYPNASSEELKIKGYYAQYPGAKKLKACSGAYTHSAKNYDIFLPTFYLSVPVTHQTNVELYDIKMGRYGLERPSLEVNNVTVFTRGLFDVSRVLQAPVYASLPRFLYGYRSLGQELNLPKPNEKKHGSYVDIEPISGSAMQLKLRIQLNGKILNTSIDKSYIGHNNVTYINKPIPVVWSEVGLVIDEDAAKKFASQLHGALRLSCGLVVALPVIGGILLLIGGILIVLAIKKRDAVSVA